VIFEWNPGKAEANRRKHGVSFNEATTVFLDPLAFTFQDPGHSRGEQRYLTFGESTEGRVLVVAHREIDEDHIRIINARRATKREAHGYRERR
jgi:uncharacterized protein